MKYPRGPTECHLGGTHICTSFQGLWGSSPILQVKTVISKISAYKKLNFIVLTILATLLTLQG